MNSSESFDNEFNEIAKASVVANIVEPGTFTPMPTPGYFTSRIEHLIDKLELEARRIDETGAAPTHLWYSYQCAVQAFFQMANLSVHYYVQLAPPSCGHEKTAPDREDIVLENPDPCG